MRQVQFPTEIVNQYLAAGHALLARAGSDRQASSTKFGPYCVGNVRRSFDFMPVLPVIESGPKCGSVAVAQQNRLSLFNGLRNT